MNYTSHNVFFYPAILILLSKHSRQGKYNHLNVYLREIQRVETTDGEVAAPSSKSGDTPIAGTPQKQENKPSRSMERKPRGTPQTDDEGMKPTPRAQVFKAPTAALSTMAPCRSTRYEVNNTLYKFLADLRLRSSSGLLYLVHLVGVSLRVLAQLMLMLP